MRKFLVACLLAIGLFSPAYGMGLIETPYSRLGTAVPDSIRTLHDENAAFLLSRRNVEAQYPTRRPSIALPRMGFTANSWDNLEETIRGFNDMRLHHFKYGGLGEVGGSLNGDSSNFRFKYTFRPGFPIR